jgi:hypothetical protein
MADQKPIDSERRPAKKQSVLVSYYSRVMVNEVRRFRKGFTRENLISTMKTLAWVIPLTLLIWVYAEREQLATDPDVTIAIAVKSTDPSRIVTLVRPVEGLITCTLQGPRSRLDLVRELLQPHNNAPPITVEIDNATPLGPSIPIPLLQKIENNPKFKNNGVSVIRCSPEDILVSVDRLEEREATVVAPANIPSLESATFAPATVRVRGPHQLLETLSANGHLTVTADIAALPELKTPGKHTVNNVQLLPDQNLTISNAPLQAVLTVKEPDVEYEVKDLPVLIEGPGTLFNRYRINYDTILPSVKVSGPPAQIEKLKSGEIHPVAKLRISTEDIKNPKPLPLQIEDLPPGVSVSPSENPEATFSVVDRGG